MNVSLMLYTFRSAIQPKTKTILNIPICIIDHMLTIEIN